MKAWLQSALQACSAAQEAMTLLYQALRGKTLLVCAPVLGTTIPKSKHADADGNNFTARCQVVTTLQVL